MQTLKNCKWQGLDTRGALGPSAPHTSTPTSECCLGLWKALNDPMNMMMVHTEDMETF